jgi:hypothetical protein
VLIAATHFELLWSRGGPKRSARRDSKVATNSKREDALNSFEKLVNATTTFREKRYDLLPPHRSHFAARQHNTPRDFLRLVNWSAMLNDLWKTPG